jgi:hypothetical protein
MLLPLVLAGQLMHVVNQYHFKWNVGVPGVAPANLIFLLALLMIRSKPETVTAPPILKNAILIFFGALTFAFLWAQVRAFGDFLDDLTYYKNALFAPLFYFLFLRCRQDLKMTRLLILWLLVVAAVAGLEGLIEGIDYGFGKYNPFRRASGPFGEDWHNANRAGVFYAMFMPMFVALALFLKRQKLVRLGAVGAAILTAGGSISTYSRQSYFLVVLALAALFLRKSLILVVLVVVATVSFASYLPDSMFQRVEETKQEDKAGNEEVDVSTSSRWELWEGGMKILAANPVGVGLHRWKDEIGNYSKYKHVDAHNFYVLTLVECNPLGLLSLLYLVYTLFRLSSWLRANRPPDDPEMFALSLGFTLCTLNMALGGIYGSPTLEASVMAPYWALAGLLERYTHLKMQSREETAPAAPAGDSLADRFPLATHIAPGRR